MNRRRVDNKYIMLTMVAFILIFLLLLGGNTLSKADNTDTYVKSFRSVEIRPGETLTSIAHTYALSPAHYTEYIEEVKNINNLKSDTIHSGCYLMIPVYEVSSPDL